MARNIDQIIQEQLGGLSFMLCVKDSQIETLTDENKKLKDELDKLKGQDKDKVDGKSS
jgi:cell division protein FtsB